MIEFSRSQKEIQKAAREFAVGEFDREAILEMEKRREFPEAQWKKAAELGFIGITFPESFEGGGSGLFDACIVAETFCRKDSSMGSALMSADFGCECFARFANGDLKAGYLSAVARGETLSTAAYIETLQDGPVSTIQTTAVRDGNDWVINGYKRYVVNADKAGCLIVLCAAGSEPVLILIDSEREGVEVRDVGKRLGGNMAPVSDVEFRNVRVPDANLIGGEPGLGLRQLKAVIDERRIRAAAEAVGIARGAFDRALAYVKQREQFGRKLSAFQITRHKIADMAVKIESARLFAYHTAALFDKGRADSTQIAIAKMTASKAAVEVCDEAIQLLGGYGYMTEQDVERFFRDAKTNQITLGTVHSHKDDVAGAVIGPKRRRP